MSSVTLRHALATSTPGALASRARHAVGSGWRQLASLDRPERSRRSALAELGVLALLGLGIVALAAWLAHPLSLPAHPQRFLIVLVTQLVLYGAAAVWVWWRRVPTRGALAIIVLVAVAARLAFAMQAPTASDDIYRYVWDGRIQAAGINPYRYVPDDPALAAYRDEAIFPHINRRAVPTIYPPAAQGVFRLVYALHPDSVPWTRLTFVGFDLVTILALSGLLLRLGLRPERVILYAWHPLLILELGHSGHVDVVAICFLVLALRARLGARPWQAGFLLACAALTKFYAIIALPALLDPRRRRDLRLPLACVVTIGLAYLPFLGVGGKVFGYLGGYVQEEGIASGDRYYLLGLARGLWSRLPAARAGRASPMRRNCTAACWWRRWARSPFGAGPARCLRRAPSRRARSSSSASSSPAPRRPTPGTRCCSCRSSPSSGRACSSPRWRSSAPQASSTSSGGGPAQVAGRAHSPTGSAQWRWR